MSARSMCRRQVTGASSKVWYAPQGGLGTSSYPTNGFIYSDHAPAFDNDPAPIQPERNRARQYRDRHRRERARRRRHRAAALILIEAAQRQFPPRPVARSQRHRPAGLSRRP